MVLRLADIVDLNNGERALMAVWNRYRKGDQGFQLARFSYKYFHSFLSAHRGRVLRHMDELTRQFVREKGQELVELGLYRFSFLQYFWEVVIQQLGKVSL